jgi:hypothetical protein
MTEETEYSYDVVAKDESEARHKIFCGDINEETYNIIDSHNCQIESVEEIKK